MTIYKIQEDRIVELNKTTFENEHLLETRDLQKFIINSIESIESDLFILANEFGDWEDSRRKIDILCLDKNANLVVMELKRTEDGGHMELQSIRYASMVANMTFEKAERAHKRYLQNQGITDQDAKSNILAFLEWEEVKEDDFGNDVRIILVSADFSIEITNSVLWLIDRGIDIKCIRMKLQKDNETLYLDIQQIIPLPEASDYQVKLREKAIEQRQARQESQRDYSKYNLYFGKESFERKNKRDAMFLTMQKCIENHIAPEELIHFTGDRCWIWVDSICKTTTEFETAYNNSLHKIKYDPKRWFNNDDQLLIHNGKTYLFTNQHGGDVIGSIRNILNHYHTLNGSIELSDK